MKNKLLQRQVQKYFGDLNDIPENLMGLLKAVSETYDHYEKDRQMLERSIELSSNEMIGLNNQLRKDIRARIESEKRYRLIHETPFLGIALGATDGVVQTINEAFCEMLGYTAEELQNRHFSFFSHPDDVEKEQPFIQAMNDGLLDSYQLEKRYITKSGTIIWVELSVSCAKNEAGEIQFVISVVQNITKRKNAEEKLEKSEKKFRALIEYGTDIVSMTDQDSLFIYLSPSFEKEFGYSPEEYLGKNGLDFVHPDDFPVLKTIRENMLLEPGKPFDIIYRIRNKQGKYLWCEGVSINMLNVDGVNAIVSNIRNITNRKETEETLEVTLGRLKQAQEIVHLGHWEADLQNGKSIWSEEAFRIYGMEPGEVEPSYALFMKHVHPDDLELMNTIAEQSVKNFSPFSLHHRIIDKKGNHKYILSVGQYEVDKSGKPLRLFGIALDLTEQKAKEEQLKRTEANLRNILENTETAYVLLDTEANILSFNKIAIALASDEMGEELSVGKNYIDIMLPQRKEDVKNIIDRVLQSREKISYDVQYEHASGSSRWLHTSMQPILGAEGKLLGLSVAATDITNAKKTEQLIRISNERYELMTRATNDVVWDWDLDNNRMYRSENYKQVFGYHGGNEVSNNNAWMVRIHEEERERVINHINETICNLDAVTWEDEYRYKRINGEYAYVQDRGYIIRSKSGKPLRIVGAMRDISIQKQLSVEREQTNAELIRQNKDLEQFAYIVSHNLRAPVANILGLSKVLREEFNDEMIRMKCLDGLALSVTKLDEVIIDLSQILKIRHQINEEKKIVQFSTLIEDIKTSVTDFIHKENALIKTNFNEVDEIYTLKSYLYSILYNLITNSFKYRNPLEQPVIEITSRQTNGTIQIIVKDNGIGIDLEKNGSKVFGLYKRFHSNIEGKGMGLFMVKTQIETLGGRISIKSAVNKGTEFTLEFEKQVIPGNNSA